MTGVDHARLLIITGADQIIIMVIRINENGSRTIKIFQAQALGVRALLPAKNKRSFSNKSEEHQALCGQGFQIEKL